MQINEINHIYSGADQRQSLYDLQVPLDWNGTLIIFLHGYMGYKDWGCWNLVSDFFTEKHFGVLKYNVSHNGGTIDNAIDFDDLEAFSRNTYVKELQDFQAILSLIENKFNSIPPINLIGHSRGGAMALLNSDNGHVGKIATWAAVSSLADRFPKGKALKFWEAETLLFIKNGRTHQQMPHHFDQYKSFVKFQERLDIKKYCLQSTTPTFVVHGDNDPSVSIEDGKKICEWLDTDLTIIEGTQHTFDSSQPWTESTMPSALKDVCEKTLEFFWQGELSNELENEKLSLLSTLIKLAKSDDQIRTSEFQFLFSIAQQMGIDRTNFERLFNEYIDFNPPRFELDRIVQFQRLVLLMNIDSDIDDKELIFVKDVGIRMGLNPIATEQVLKRMYDYENCVIPPNELLNIFNTYNN